MRKPIWLKNKALVLGLGREGLSTIQFLRHHFPEVKIEVADVREWSQFSVEEKAILDIIKQSARHLGADYLSCLPEFEVIFKTPGENRRKPQIQAAIRRGAMVTSATNLFFELCQGQVVAVTGSKGKSTTSSLIYAVLKEGGLKVELIGNIGRAALDYLEHDAPDSYYVFELSSYQLEDYRGGADIAVFVSFFPDHLDYHGGLEGYFKAKMQLAAQVKPGLRVLYNFANDILRDYFETFAQAFAGDVQVLPFNEGKHSLVREIDGRYEVIWNGELLIREDQVKLEGKHNLENMLAAAEVANLLGIPLEKQRQAFINFIPLEHRLEPVGVFKGIAFYNDAISTTPESTIAALEAMGRKQTIGTLIVGGLDRGYKFDDLALKILDSKVENVILSPDTGAKIERSLQKFGKNWPHPCPVAVHCSNMTEAVEKAYQVTRPETICLLSCASPSYNLYKNFEEKGRLYKEAVKKLAQ